MSVAPESRVTSRVIGSRRRTGEASGREDDEDVVLEVMDFLTGWSSPHVRL